MNSATPTPLNQEQMLLIQKKLKLEANVKNGVNWFFWIAGLSIINSIIYYAGSSITFVVGLGATQFVDGFAAGLAQDLSVNSRIIIQVIGFGLDIAIAGIFIVAGILGRKKYRWAIITGMVLYVLDAGIFIYVGGWLAVIFHALALGGIWQGLSAINKLGIIEQNSPGAVPANISQLTSAFAEVEKSERRNLRAMRIFVFLFGTIMIVGLIIVVAVVLTR